MVAHRSSFCCPVLQWGNLTPPLAGWRGKPGSGPSSRREHFQILAAEQNPNSWQPLPTSRPKPRGLGSAAPHTLCFSVPFLTPRAISSVSESRWSLFYFLLLDFIYHCSSVSKFLLYSEIIVPTIKWYYGKKIFFYLGINTLNILAFLFIVFLSIHFADFYFTCSQFINSRKHFQISFFFPLKNP